MTSPRRSPMRDAENSTPPLSPPAKTPSRPQTPAREDRPVASPLRLLVSSPAKTPSRPQTPAREDGPVAYPLRSPLRRAELPTPPRTPPDEPAPPPAVTIANRLTRDGVSPAEKEISEGGGGVRAGEGGSVRGALGLRVAAFVLSMIAFSVMAADKTDGWAGDSFDRYKEFRYLVAVNVLAFAYSAFQVCEKIYRKICTRHIMSRRMGCYFDLSMDQILAYLLMSASSAAASRNDVWVSRFGSDGFTHKANASIAMSFLAFVAVALSSLVSAYKLFGRSP